MWKLPLENNKAPLKLSEFRSSAWLEVKQKAKNGSLDTRGRWEGLIGEGSRASKVHRCYNKVSRHFPDSYTNDC